jgi:protein-disulfide isomerase
VDVERYRVPLAEDDYALGGDQPFVTIVSFSDYACGPCGVLWRVFKNLEEDYGDQIRIVHRGVGVAGFKDGERAAEAAYAAGAQGKFWAMHWRLFQHQDDFSRPALLAHAKAIGLDMEKFESDIDTGAQAGRRLRDKREAKRLGVSAAPIVFVNGMVFVGPKPDENMWHSLIDAELATVRERVATGVPRAKIYENVQAGALERPLPTPDAVKKLQKEVEAAKPEIAAFDYTRVVKPKPGERYDIPLEGASILGEESAPVTIVEFMDFQCPICRKQHQQSMKALRDKYGDKIRFAVLNLPLEMHREARPAAVAALAARKQGRYWDFHDRFFSPGAVFDRGTYVQWAQELGLDVDQFKKDLNDPEVNKQIEADRLLSYKLGITATPTMFLNGRFIEGFANESSMSRAIDEELAAAEEAGGGTISKTYYTDLMATAIKEADFPNVAQLSSSAPTQP